MNKRRRRPAELSRDDEDLLPIMRAWDLKPGQMLLIGPRSAAMLIGMEDGRKLPDAFVLEKAEWNGHEDVE